MRLFWCYLQLDALALNNTLAVLAVELLLSRLESVECVELGDDTECQTHRPEAVGLLLVVLGSRVLADADGVGDSQGIEGQVTSVTELATDGSIAQDGIQGFGVGGDSGSLDVLNVLAESHNLADQAELLLDGIPRDDLGGCAVGTEQVPGVEAGEVLKGSQELVATDGCGDEAQVVSHRRVVDEGVGNHIDWR